MTMTAFMFKEMRTSNEMFFFFYFETLRKMMKRTTSETYVFFNRSGYGEGREKAANTSWSESEGENIKKPVCTSKSIY